jgi:hypothetical protein
MVGHPGGEGYDDVDIWWGFGLYISFAMYFGFFIINSRVVLLGYFLGFGGFWNIMIFCFCECSNIVGGWRSSRIQVMEFVNELLSILDVLYGFPSIFFPWISFPMYKVLQFSSATAGIFDCFDIILCPFLSFDRWRRRWFLLIAVLRLAVGWKVLFIESGMYSWPCSGSLSLYEAEPTFLMTSNGPNRLSSSFFRRVGLSWDWSTQGKLYLLVSIR